MCGGKVLLLLSLLVALEHSHSAPTPTDTDAVAPHEDFVDNNAESSGSEPSRHSAVMDYSNEPARYHDDPKLTAEEMWDDSTKVREEKRQTEYWDDPETVKPDAVESTTTAFNATEIADTSTNQTVFNAVETNDTSTNQSAIENEETSDQPDFTTYSNDTVEEAQFTNTTETVFDSTTVTTTTGHETSTAIPKETETESEEEFREMKVELQETRNVHWHQHEQIFQDQTLKIVDMFRRFLQKQFKW